MLDLSHEVQKLDEEISASFDCGEGKEENNNVLLSARKRSSSAARHVAQYFGLANGTSGLVSSSR